jgi:hypothetical protein
VSELAQGDLHLAAKSTSATVKAASEAMNSSAIRTHVERLGGRLRLDSEAGTATTPKIVLPRSAP